MALIETDIDLACYHCGQPCDDESFSLEDKVFCCLGCKTVFEILNANDLCEYYDLSKTPGVKADQINVDQYLYLDEEKIRNKMLSFDSLSFAKVTLSIPAIHCISCVWLLEHLQKMDTGIIKSEVNFSKKSITIDYNPNEIKLSGVVGLLNAIGYYPIINLDTHAPGKKNSSLSLVIKLSVAGFCFGNIMLFSFPEYLGADQSDKTLLRLFSWLNLALALPVFFYSAIDYLRAALKAFKQRQINIDVPIAIGLVALFSRSSYEVITNAGAGYLDSFAGLVFFLLIGRWFQSKTYESLSFDRDFKSYFPLAVQRWATNDWTSIVIYELKKGDMIRVRNMEIIPADSLLQDRQAYIDYSFVTGESRPVKVNKGDLVYAGGRLIGTPVILVIEKDISQSHLTSLWNHDAFRKKEESKYLKIIDRTARAFTWIVLAFTLVVAIYWSIASPTEMWLIVTAVLMVACPCALALAAPFTYGGMLREFGKNKLYLKSADVIERMATVDAIVFDKTGTLTHSQTPSIEFHGVLSEAALGWIKILSGYSTHPLSIIIHQSIKQKSNDVVTGFMEYPGKGLEGYVNGIPIKIGSASFAGFSRDVVGSATNVFVSVNHEVIGYFSIRISLRKNIRGMIKRMSNKCVALLSGDSDRDEKQMRTLFTDNTQLLFHQSPHDKLHFISTLQQKGKKVMMLGDGLNDAGAMKQSDVGLAVTDDAATFTPACDGILNGDRLKDLDKFISLAKSSSIILKIAFGISFCYNAIALTFAATGHLTPLVAAILMPVSSISVVGFSSLAVRFMANQKFKTV